jgi:hypothetical protein
MDVSARQLENIIDASAMVAATFRMFEKLSLAELLKR